MTTLAVLTDVWELTRPPKGTATFIKLPAYCWPPSFHWLFCAGSPCCSFGFSFGVGLHRLPGISVHPCLTRSSGQSLPSFRDRLCHRAARLGPPLRYRPSIQSRGGSLDLEYSQETSWPLLPCTCCSSVPK